MPGQPVAKSGYMASKVINTAMIFAAVIACFMQIPIDDSTDNIACAVLALIGSLTVFIYLRYSDAFETHPISTFAIFGFCATSTYGALLVQSMTLTSLSKDLRQPEETFIILGAFQLISICGHIAYRYFNKPESQAISQPSIRTILTRIGVYSTPTVLQLWILGLIGILAIFAVGGSESTESKGIFSKFCIGISFLAWSPFLIPILAARIGKTYCDTKFHFSLVALFAVFVGVIGIAANARYMIVSGVTTTVLITLLMTMRSRRSVTMKQILKVTIALLILSSMLVPMAELATAMVVVRGAGHHSSGYNVILATVDVLQRPELVEAQRKKDKLAAYISSYDEVYIENPLLQRFVLTKYHDNALFFESKLSDRAIDELGETTLNLFWTLLPDPILKFFDIPIVKRQYVFSMGDYLYYQATGGTLGGFKVGSIFGQGIGLFGWYFSVVYLVLCIVSFWILDFLASINFKGEITVSVVGILLIWRLYLYGISAESINGTVGFLFREVPQSIFLFIIFYQASRLISYIFLLFGHKQSKNSKKTN